MTGRSDAPRRFHVERSWPQVNSRTRASRKPSPAVGWNERCGCPPNTETPHRPAPMGCRPVAARAPTVRECHAHRRTNGHVHGLEPVRCDAIVEGATAMPCAHDSDRVSVAEQIVAEPSPGFCQLNGFDLDHGDLHAERCREPNAVRAAAKRRFGVVQRGRKTVERDCAQRPVTAEPGSRQHGDMAGRTTCEGPSRQSARPFMIRLGPSGQAIGARSRRRESQL